MYDQLETKVVLKQTVLTGSSQSGRWQRVAIVYIDDREFRVSAPPDATGDAVDWVPHFIVTQQGNFDEEVDAAPGFNVLVRKLVKEDLEKHKRDASRVAGMHPDGLHCDAQICLKGHVQHCDGMPFNSTAHCTKCGAACIDECAGCKEPIRGVHKLRPIEDFSRPNYCHRCGLPYPWMENLLRTARELLERDDKLSIEERNNLLGDLQYVMSDPKADLASAKKKLIEVKLGKATSYVREFVLDLLAKTAAESMKG